MSEAWSNVVNVKLLTGKYKALLVSVVVLLSSLGLTVPAHASAYNGDSGTVNCTSGTFLVSENVVVFSQGRCSGVAEIPDGVTSIGNSAFQNLTGLTSVTIPATVTRIGIGAFQFADGLTSVTIPASVTSIGTNAFRRARTLNSITVETDNQSFVSINGVLFDKDATTLIQYPSGKSGAYSIPDGVTSIGNRAFELASNLTSISIPARVTSIGDYAFTDTVALKGVFFLGNAPTFGQCLFCGGNLAATVYASTKATGFTLDEDVRWNNRVFYRYEKAEPFVKPVVSGKAQIGKGLTAKKGDWYGAPSPKFSYQWYLCAKQVKGATQTIPKTCKKISKATKSNLAVTKAFKRNYLAVAVTGVAIGTTPTVWLSKSTAQIN